MNSKTWTRIIIMALYAVLAIPVQLAGQDTGKQNQPRQYHRYKLIDLGTLGGPSG